MAQNDPMAEVSEQEERLLADWLEADLVRNQLLEDGDPAEIERAQRAYDEAKVAYQVAIAAYWARRDQVDAESAQVSTEG